MGLFLHWPILMHCGVLHKFFPLVFSLTLQTHSFIGLASIVHLSFDHFVFQLTLWGFKSSPTSVVLDCLLVYLLVFCLPSIFVACQTASRFWAFRLGLLPSSFYLQDVLNKNVCPTNALLRFNGCLSYFWVPLSMFCPKTLLPTPLLPSFIDFLALTHFL